VQQEQPAAADENDKPKEGVLSSGKKNSNKNRNNNGFLVRLRPGEYTGAKSANADGSNNNNNSSTSRRDLGNNSSPRLFRGDLVGFRIFLDKRTKQKYARQITLHQSERERRRIEKEQRLLDNATTEEGIVVSLNKGFGFATSGERTYTFTIRS